MQQGEINSCKYQLQTTEIPDQPFAKVGIDLIGDLDISHKATKIS